MSFDFKRIHDEDISVSSKNDIKIDPLNVLKRYLFVELYIKINFNNDFQKLESKV
jgi:hypothetical protein